MTREFDPSILETMSAQIGRMTIAGISGGRRIAVDENTLHLPVSQGYRVEVEYMPAMDAYAVRRVTVRKSKGVPVRKVKGEVVGVFADQLSEAAWQAHAHRSYEFGEIGGQNVH